MNHAYIFPFGIEIDPVETHRAIPVNLETDHDILAQAAGNDRLRCPYGACLEPVTLVHREAGKKKLRCFAHLPEGSHPCPFRSDSDPNGGGPKHRREHNLRKQIENALHIDLQRNLAGRGKNVRIQSSPYEDAEPCIRITGLGPPLQVRGLGPGCEALWRQPFDGSINGEEVLFFTLSTDVPALKQPFIDSHLLARRPAILVNPAEGENGEHTYSLVSRLGEESAVRLLDTLDLIRVDLKQLFGLDRPAEYHFLPVDHRRAIEAIGERLAVPGLASAKGKMLRLLAKHVLVKGSPVHSVVFGQSPENAQHFFVTTQTFPQDGQIPNTLELGLLLQDQDTKENLQDFCTGIPLLAPLWGKLFSDAFAALAVIIVSLRKQADEAGKKLAAQQEAWKKRDAELAERLAAVTAKQADLKRRVDEIKDRRTNLEDQLRGKEQAWKDREAELTGNLKAAAASQADLERRLAETEARWKEAKADLDWIDSYRIGHQVLEHHHRMQSQAPGH